ncbi:TIGR00366 family protein [Acidocella aminolytica]|nr:TIGR00366 family protein [Acidocella aminolytica]
MKAEENETGVKAWLCVMVWPSASYARKQMQEEVMSSSRDLPALSGGAEHKRIVDKIVYVFEQLLPDPFILSIGLTVLVAALAVILVPGISVSKLLNSWYTGAFKIIAFAFQMVLILLTGFAVADAPAVRAILGAMAKNVKTPAQAVILLFPVVAIAAWLNWGLGLVVAAFLSREIARRAQVDFGWLVAGSYSAWSICNNGLSSSIALSQATHGNEMNFVEKITGQLIPLSQTIFAPFVLVPTVLVVVVMAVIFVWMHPKGDDLQSVQIEDEAGDMDSHSRTALNPGSPAARMERSPLGTIVLLALGLGLIWTKVASHSFVLDINMTILIFLLVGLALQGRPINYAYAVRNGVRQTGSMVLQYPMYGGIMGIMAGTGLAALIAKGFVNIASSHSLPLWSYVSSMIITLLVPSAGGHWAVQGPFVVPAAVTLHASVAHTAMGVAMAENVSNMLQPFWAVPVVAMAGIRLQRVMGYTAVTFLVSFVIYAASLLFIP